ncbi:MAG: HAMP domain-containing protein [Candidatus Levybacteria bacterium]|nr:HAMP domain-containing protein [Candidatus Levybacteria bacterium]
MKLLHKVAVIIFSLAIIVAVIFASIIYMLTLSSLKEAISTEQVEVARQTMDKIDRLLYERMNNIIAISEDEEFEGFLAGKDLTILSEKAESTTKLRELSSVTGPWDALNLVNKEGEIVLSASGRFIGQNIKEELIKHINFDDVFNGEVRYSDVLIDSRTKKPTMIFASPIRNEEDVKQPVIGMAIGYLSWPVILEILQSTHDNTVELFNKNGQEIGDNESENASEILSNSFISHPSVKKALSGVSGSEVRKGIDKNKDKDQLISFVPQKGFLINKGNGWGLIIETPVAIAFADATQNALNMVLIVIPVVFMAAIAVLFVLQKVFIKPVINLTNSAQALSKGDFSKRIDVTSRDEIGMLGTSFNEMMTKLKDYQESLEQKVTERTKQLEDAQVLQVKQLEETERINKLLVGRELKMVELKKQIATLKKKS